MKWQYGHGSSLIPLFHSVKPMLIALVYSTAGNGSSQLGQDGYVDLADTVRFNIIRNERCLYPLFCDISCISGCISKNLSIETTQVQI